MSSLASFDPYAVLESLGVRAKAAKAAKADPWPLPPIGDPRRVPLEVIDAVWEAGAWLLIEGESVRAVPRDGTTASLTPELVASVKEHQAGLLRALTRRPPCR